MNRVRPRELFACALIIILMLGIAFASLKGGRKTMLSAAIGIPSIMPAGAYTEHPRVWDHPQRTADPGGIAWFADPYYALIHNQVFRDHIVPLWNPYNGCGVPLLANMQSQVLNPLQVIAWTRPSPHAVDFYLLARLFVAGGLMYLFLRLWTGSAAAMTGSTAFMLTGYMIIYLGMPDISVCVEIPGLFWSVEKLLRQRSPVNAVLAALFVALVLVGGMPEVSFFALIFVSLYALTRIISLRAGVAMKLRILLAYADACVRGLMLAAPMVFPFLEYLQYSWNSHDRTDVPLPGLMTTPNCLMQLLSYVAPLAYGPLGRWSVRPGVAYAGQVGYWGASVFFLALIAIVSAFKLKPQDGNESTDPDRGLRVITIFSAVSWFLLVAKRFGFPLIQWIGALPGFRYCIFGKYGEPLIAFFIATLAGLGVHVIQSRRVSAKRVLQYLLGCGFVFGALALHDAQYVSVHKLYWLTVFGAFVGLIAAFLPMFLAARRPRLFSRIAPYAVAAVFVELCFNFLGPTYWKFSPLGAASLDPYKGAPFVEFLQKNIHDHERVLGYDSVFSPNWSSVFGIQDVRVIDAMYPQRLIDLLQTVAYGRLKRPLPLEDHNLSNRFDGQETATDPLHSHHFERIVRLWQLTSTRYILGLVSRTVSPATPAVQQIVSEQKGVDKNNLRVDVVECGGVARSAMFEHPYTHEKITANYHFEKNPEKRFLFFRIGIGDDAIKRGVTDGVFFSVCQQSPTGSKVVYARGLNPVAIAGDRGWTTIFIDTDKLESKNGSVDMQFIVDPGPSRNANDDHAAWSDIQLLSSAVEPIDPVPPIKLEPVYNKEIRIERIPKTLPRAAVYYRTVAARNSEDALTKTLDPATDLFSNAIVEDVPSLNGGGTCEAADITEYTPNRVSVQLTARSNALLVLSDCYTPGWNAYLDDARVPIIRSNYLFRGVSVTAGKHRVVFRYEPVSFYFGVLWFLAAVVGSIAWCLVGNRRLK